MILKLRLSFLLCVFSDLGKGRGHRRPTENLHYNFYFLRSRLLSPNNRTQLDERRFYKGFVDPRI